MIVSLTVHGSTWTAACSIVTIYENAHVAQLNLKRLMVFLERTIDHIHVYVVTITSASQHCISGDHVCSTNMPVRSNDWSRGYRLPQSSTTSYSDVAIREARCLLTYSVPHTRLSVSICTHSLTHSLPCAELALPHRPKPTSIHMSSQTHHPQVKRSPS